MFSTPATLYPTLQLISEPDTGHALPPLPSSPSSCARTYVCNLQSRPRTLAFLSSLFLPFSFPSISSPFPFPNPSVTSPPHLVEARLHDYSKLILTHYTQKGHRMASWQVCDPSSLSLFLPSPFSSSGKREIRSFSRLNNHSSDFIRPII